jgi:hypothetical protein
VSKRGVSPSLKTSLSKKRGKGGGVPVQISMVLAFMHNASRSRILIVKIPPSFLKEGG